MTMDKWGHQLNRLIHDEYRNPFLLVLGMLVMLIGEFSTALSVASILTKFDNGGTAVQLVNILPLVLLALMYPLGPVWLQKSSIPELFKGSLAIFIGGTLLISFAPSLMWLLIGRILQTVGCGMLLPMLPLLILALLPENTRIAHPNQMEDLILGVAIILALLLTGGAFLLGNWQYINLFLIILSLIIYFKGSSIEIDLEVSHYEVEWTNVALSSGFLALIGWLVTLTKTGAQLPVGINGFCLVAGIILLIGYLWRELRVKNPLIDFRALFNIRYLRAVLLQGIGEASLAILMVIGVLYLRQGLKYPIFLIALSLLPSILVMLAVHYLTAKFFDRFKTVTNVRIATGLMMVGWGCLSLFSTYLNLILFIILTMIIEAGHGLLIQVGKRLSRKQKSKRLANMADIFMAQFKLMFAGILLTVLSVVLQNVTESHSASGLPGKLSALAGYRAAFSIFFVITILGWIIATMAGRKLNLFKHIVK
jgi:DHA2 family lincomycin resistance protein-like MFS transporter